MAEESVSADRIAAFTDKVANLRGGPDCAKLRPADIASTAARNLGIFSAVLPLTYAGLRGSADCESAALDEVRFWVEASVGVTSCAGGFAKGWLDAFNEQFFGKVSGIRDLPSPNELKVSRESARCFKMMLQAAVAFAENKGKVGKMSINKCPGFHVVKYWGESVDWSVGAGFREEDRILLKSIASGCRSAGTKRSDPTVATGGDIEDARNRIEDLQQKLNESRRNAVNLEAEMQAVRKELVVVSAKLERSRSDGETSLEQIVSCKARIRDFEVELASCRDEMAQKESAFQKRMSEMQRQSAMAENHLKARMDAVAEVVSPIRRQLDDARSKPMSAELGGVLLTHIVRIIDVLKENGFDV